MNYALIASVLAAAVGTSTLLVSEADLNALLHDGTTTLARVQETNNRELLKAARIMYSLNTGDMSEPSAEKLVELGYLDAEFLKQKKVEVSQ